MTPIEEQILINQYVIMGVLLESTSRPDQLEALSNNRIETYNILQKGLNNEEFCRIIKQSNP